MPILHQYPDKIFKEYIDKKCQEFLDQLLFHSICPKKEKSEIRNYMQHPQITNTGSRSYIILRTYIEANMQTPFCCFR